MCLASIIARKNYYVKLTSDTNLTGNSSAVKHRVFRLRLVPRRVRVHVNRVQPFMPFEELLPQRSQWNWTLGQEQERDLRPPLERVLGNPRAHRRPP